MIQSITLVGGSLIFVAFLNFIALDSNFGFFTKNPAPTIITTLDQSMYTRQLAKNYFYGKNATNQFEMEHNNFLAPLAVKAFSSASYNLGWTRFSVLYIAVISAAIFALIYFVLRNLGLASLHSWLATSYVLIQYHTLSLYFASITKDSFLSSIRLCFRGFARLIIPDPTKNPLYDLIRFPSRGLDMICIVLAMLLCVLALKNPSWRRICIILLPVLCMLSIGTSVYSWFIIVGVCGAYFLTCMALEQRLFSPIVGFASTLLPGAVAMIVYGDIYSTDKLRLVGTYFSHRPAVEYFALPMFVACCLLAVARRGGESIAAWRVTATEDQKIQFFLLATLLSGALAANQNIVTGKEVQLYHIARLMVPLCIIGFCYVLHKAFASQSWLLSAAFSVFLIAAIFILAGVYSAYITRAATEPTISDQAAGESIAEFMTNQSRLEPLPISYILLPENAGSAERLAAVIDSSSPSFSFPPYGPGGDLSIANRFCALHLFDAVLRKGGFNEGYRKTIMEGAANRSLVFLYNRSNVRPDIEVFPGDRASQLARFWPDFEKDGCSRSDASEILRRANLKYVVTDVESLFSDTKLVARAGGYAVYEMDLQVSEVAIKSEQ